jgi:perosamine synthetase
MIRLARPWITDEDLSAVCAVLESGALVQGDRVEGFERDIARYIGVSHAVAVSSGTAALHLALLAMGIGSGEVVFVPGYSFPATANAVVLAGARPWFVDVDAETFCMDPAALRSEIRAAKAGGLHLRAVMPVHAFGHCAPMVEIQGLAREHGLLIIEDAACALGASLDGRRAGTWGEAACFSFHPRKTLTTGEGGMLVTQDAELAARTRLLRNHGMERRGRDVTFPVVGFNYRMTEIAAALGSSQLNRYATMLRQRVEAAAYYDARLAGVPARTPVVAAAADHVYQTYVVVLSDRLCGVRNELLDYASSMGVELGIGTYHLPGLDAYEGADTTTAPTSRRLSVSSVALPLYFGILREEQDRVVDCIASFFQNHEPQ